MKNTSNKQSGERMTNTRTEINQVSKKVLKILESDERARGDDKWLTYKVFREYTNIYIPFEDFKNLPSFETVSRCRRKIQNKDGLFLPTDNRVRMQRKVRREIFKEMMSKNESIHIQ